MFETRKVEKAEKRNATSEPPIRGGKDISRATDLASNAQRKL